MRRLLVAAVAALIIASPVAADHIGIGWPKGPPDIIYTNATGSTLTRLESAIALWNVSPYVEWSVVQSTRGSMRYNGVEYDCGKRKGAIVVCIAEHSSSFAMLDYGPRGLAGVFIGTLPLANQAVFCEELGHALGLFHSADLDSCLGPTINGDHPSAHDYDALTLLYGP